MNIIKETKNWIEKFVIGLNICPFAKSVFIDDCIRYQVCRAARAEELLDALVSECRLLDEEPTILTTLLLIPEGLESFEDYLDVTAAAESRMLDCGYQGIYQLASFHPAYVFADCDANDAANATNRAPYPTWHIIREEELSRALEQYPHPEKIPERNIKVCRELGHEGLRALLRAHSE